MKKLIFIAGAAVVLGLILSRKSRQAKTSAQQSYELIGYRRERWWH
jgi:hypothetical protein